TLARAPWRQMRGATKEHSRQRSVTEEQRSRCRHAAASKCKGYFLTAPNYAAIGLISNSNRPPPARGNLPKPLFAPLRLCVKNLARFEKINPKKCNFISLTMSRLQISSKNRSAKRIFFNSRLLVHIERSISLGLGALRPNGAQSATFTHTGRQASAMMRRKPKIGKHAVCLKFEIGT
ncbi:MAG TPA: hypothetical protein VG146_14460, partial [Verrucomicrobiae bacterium]|nr:hypothetical protein [Verrucomicrobiae bacterium]